MNLIGSYTFSLYLYILDMPNCHLQILECIHKPLQTTVELLNQYIASRNWGFIAKFASYLWPQNSQINSKARKPIPFPLRNTVPPTPSIVVVFYEYTFGASI